MCSVGVHKSFHLRRNRQDPTPDSGTERLCTGSLRGRHPGSQFTCPRPLSTPSTRVGRYRLNTLSPMVRSTKDSSYLEGRDRDKHLSRGEDMRLEDPINLAGWGREDPIDLVVTGTRSDQVVLGRTPPTPGSRSRSGTRQIVPFPSTGRLPSPHVSLSPLPPCLYFVVTSGTRHLDEKTGRTQYIRQVF